jgi:hydrogenase nickel incorporation protein HypA/HybF
MHEFSICRSIIAVVLAEMKKIKNRRARLRKVNIIAGQYHRLVPANLKFAYKILTRDTAAEGSALCIKSMPVILKCHACGWQGRTNQAFFLCKKCGQGNVEITGGKELCLESLELETVRRSGFRVQGS